MAGKLLVAIIDSTADGLTFAAPKLDACTTVLDTLGLKSTQSLNENSSPVLGETNTGISCVLISVADGAASSTIALYDWYV